MQIVSARVSIALLAALIAPFSGETFAAQENAKPNIVLLLIDDWAWNGSPVPMDDRMDNSKMPLLQMPNLERLAREVAAVERITEIQATEQLEGILGKAA